MLLSNLNLLVTAPGGVARLRELILTLAVQGKLVSQDPADEPVRELLKKIRTEKDQLIAEGKIKRDKPPPKISDGEIPFDLPKGWVWERLGVIGNIFSGNSINSTEKVSKYALQSGLPYIATKDVGYGLEPLDYENGIRIPLGETKFKVALPGSVLICAEGGSAGRKCGLTERQICFGNKLFANTLFGGIPPKFILFTYLSPYFIESFRGAMTGIIGGISLAKFLELPIPLPPLAEQSRIVTRVEELMRLCDALEAKAQLEAAQHEQLLQTLLGSLTASTTPEELAVNWQRVAAHFDLLLDRPEAVDALEQTILQLAVRGLLVPQDPQDEPASELLKKIRAEKDRLIAAGKIKRDKPLPPIAEDEQSFDLPQGWEWVRFGSLPFSAHTGLDRGRDLQGDKFAFPYFKMNNISNGGGASFVDMTRVDATPEELTKFKLQEKDFLFNTRNSRALVGKTCVIDQLPEENTIFNNNILVSRFHGQVEAKFIDIWFRSPLGQERLDQIKSATTNVCAIYQGNLFEYLCPLPPRAEQSRIVDRVEALMRLCADLRQRLSRAQAQQALLAEVLVQEVA